jgi:hypothetical protein
MDHEEAENDNDDDDIDDKEEDQARPFVRMCTITSKRGRLIYICSILIIIHALSGPCALLCHMYGRRLYPIMDYIAQWFNKDIHIPFRYQTDTGYCAIYIYICISLFDSFPLSTSAACHYQRSIRIETVLFDCVTGS